MRFPILAALLGCDGRPDLIFRAGLLRATGQGFAARVLPAFAGVVPMKAKLRQVGSDAFKRLLGEGDPAPTANDFGEFVLARHPAFEKGKNTVNGQLSIAFAFGEVDVRAGSARGRRTEV